MPQTTRTSQRGKHTGRHEGGGKSRWESQHLDSHLCSVSPRSERCCHPLSLSWLFITAIHASHVKLWLCLFRLCVKVLADVRTGVWMAGAQVETLKPWSRVGREFLFVVILTLSSRVCFFGVFFRVNTAVCEKSLQRPEVEACVLLCVCAHVGQKSCYMVTWEGWAGTQPAKHKSAPMHACACCRCVLGQDTSSTLPSALRTWSW